MGILQIAGIVVIVLIAGFSAYNFLTIPHEQQIGMITTWLLSAVIEAEKELGGGTGKLKLSKVYGWFVEKFPFLAKKITPDQFSGLVDQALFEMKKILESNQRIASYISD